MHALHAGRSASNDALRASRLAMAGFIIPYYFMNPVLLLNVVPSSLPAVAVAVVAASLGIVALSMALHPRRTS